VIFSKKVWDSLSADEKKIIDDSADIAVKAQREAARSTVAANLDVLKKNGMTITSLPAAEVVKLREKMKPVIEKHSLTVGATVADVQAELAKLRK
jgi:TRAP-type C4-dicarboxylate transport system substrate-binding protein